jgi:lysophospholipase L1-like esterase
LPIKYYKPGQEPDAEPLSHAQAIAKFGGLEPLADPDTDYNGQFAFYKYRTLAALRQDELWAGRLDRMHAALTQLTALSRQTGDARMILAYIPAKEVFAPGGILGDGPERPLSVAELRARNPLYQYLAEFAAEFSDYIILVDGQQVLREDAEDLYFPGDAHLNVKGHARFAEALAEALLSSR